VVVPEVCDFLAFAMHPIDAAVTNWPADQLTPQKPLQRRAIGNGLFAVLSIAHCSGGGDSQPRG